MHCGINVVKIVRPKIAIRLLGGLGNQMFQYAAARALAEENEADLLFDVSAFAEYPDRAYALEPFRVAARIAEEDELAEFPTPPGAPGRIGRLRSRLMGNLGMPMPKTAKNNGKRAYREPFFEYSPELLKLKPDVYLEGYFQSELYFRHMADTIREELTLLHPLEGEAAKWAERIKASEAVSLHVRRGDYVNDPEAAKAHGVLDTDYYRNALPHVTKGMMSPELFVFTDDPEWVESSFDIGKPFTLVAGNLGAPYVDMMLMRLARAHVIANSSFSWWGAWLASFAGPVVAPKNWFGPSRRRWNTRDLLPQRWITL